MLRIISHQSQSLKSGKSGQSSLPESLKYPETSFLCRCSIVLLVLIIFWLCELGLSQPKRERLFIQNGPISRNLNSEQKELTCYIGFTDMRRDSSANQLSSLQNLKQQKHGDFIEDQSHKKWRYCIVRVKDNNQKESVLVYSQKWDQCQQHCCSILPAHQCYFKASFHETKYPQPQLLKSIRLLQSQPQSPLNQNKELALQSRILKSQQPPLSSDNSSIINQGDSQSQSQDSTTSSGYTALIILSCIFGIPFVLVVVLAIISLVQLCRQHSRPQRPNPIQPHTDPSIQFEIINLDDYKLDEVGPYHVNLQQQCSICLDQEVNIRTFCGHLYHPKCLKAWLMKAKYRCPICNCTRLNPMKVYCKKCSVAVKLVILDALVSQQFQTEINQMVCESCGSDQQSDFYNSPKRDTEEASGKKPIATVEKKKDEIKEHNQNQIDSVSIRSSDNQLTSGR